MISAHWYSSRLQVTSGEHPEMIYDFYGFPDELSQVQYPAPGSPELAEQVRSLLQPENVELNPTTWLWSMVLGQVLKYLYPNADIPVVQLSLNRLQSAEWHFNLAKKLSALREQGVLIIGSGNIVHNLRAISWEHIDQIRCGVWMGVCIPRNGQSSDCNTRWWNLGALSAARRKSRAFCANAGSLLTVAVHHGITWTTRRYYVFQW